MAVPFLPRARHADRTLAPLLDVATRLGTAAYRVWSTAAFGRTLGQKAFGIRVVSRETAGVPTLKQAVLRWAVSAVLDVLTALLPRPSTKEEEQTLAPMRALKPEVERLERQHRGDRRGLNEALMSLYAERNVDPMRACRSALLRALPVLGSYGIVFGPALLGPLHQGLHDRLSKTVVVDAGLNSASMQLQRRARTPG